MKLKSIIFCLCLYVGFISNIFAQSSVKTENSDFIITSLFPSSRIGSATLTFETIAHFNEPFRFESSTSAYVCLFLTPTNTVFCNVKAEPTFFQENGTWKLKIVVDAISKEQCCYLHQIVKNNSRDIKFLVRFTQESFDPNTMKPIDNTDMLVIRGNLSEDLDSLSQLLKWLAAIGC